jgi:hypothetical protein
MLRKLREQRRAGWFVVETRPIADWSGHNKRPRRWKPGPVSHGDTVLPLTKKPGQHDRNCSVYLRLICVNTVPRF